MKNAMENKVIELMEGTVEYMAQCLPENYEPDDCAWSENGFRIRVFDCTTAMSSMKPVGTFLFCMNSNESDKEMNERLCEEIDLFLTYYK